MSDEPDRTVVEEIVLAFKGPGDWQAAIQTYRAHTTALRARLEEAEKELDALKVENTQQAGSICALERDYNVADKAIDLAVEQRDEADRQVRALTAQLAEAVRKAEAMEREGLRLEWVHDNCRVVYYPPDGGYPYEHAPGANKIELPEIIRKFADPSIEAARAALSSAGAEKPKTI